MWALCGLNLPIGKREDPGDEVDVGFPQTLSVRSSLGLFIPLTTTKFFALLCCVYRFFFKKSFNGEDSR